LSEELAQDLLADRLIASLATLNGDGSIHVVPMWYLWDGEALLIPTNHATRKAKNLERDPRATVMIDDSRGAFEICGITLVGTVEIVRAPQSFELNRRIHLKYVTERGLALEPVRGYLSTDDIALRFLAERMSSWDMRGTERARALLESGEYHRLPPVL
jgi:PPOX class probable F420-dependent enzyme